MTRITAWLIGILAVGSVFAVQPAQAVNIGTLSSGSHFSDVITSNGPTFSQDYNFHLNNTIGGLTILATGFGQTHPGFGISSVTLDLFDATNTLITSATGATLASLDSFNATGLGLQGGDYLLTIFGNVTPTKKAFVSVSIAANASSVVPIPAAILMSLTGLSALGGLALRRRHKEDSPT
ncbi:MAG TPA: VPLPA-CTERM sorting domain-containing protein [Dongiaceae bacterium]|jgi:hypothetical protein